MLLPNHFVVFVWLGICTYAVLKLTRRKRRPYPPGPKPHPILGNLRDLPRDKEALKYNQWAREYGDLYHLSVFGTHIVVVNSTEVANDLFVKRSLNYSDRSTMTMVAELMGWNFAFGMMPFGDRWKAHRKMFDSRFRQGNISSYQPIQIECAHVLLTDLLESPEDFRIHLRHLAARTVTKVTYGLTISKTDRYKAIAEKSFAVMIHAASPGAFLVDTLPFLKYIPEWFPGAGFQTKARSWKKLTREMVDFPFEAAKNAIANGKASHCFVADVMSDLDKSGADLQQYKVLRDTAGQGYAAGVETTTSTLLAFFLAMMLYPTVQKQAQEELDKVCAGRLPDFSDRQSLPYINALCVELIRWSAVAPLGGVPHVATKDDVYNGYFIPAGTLMIGNVWAMSHNETIYPESQEFKPERFLSQDGRTCTIAGPILDMFGFGRRKCAGRFLADTQMFITVALVLKVFNIKPPPGASAAKPAYEDLFTCRLESHAIPFECSITPRGETEMALIRNEVT